MAVTFSDLHTEAGLKALDEFLTGKKCVSGDQLTKDDVKVYAAVLEQPSAELYPNASQWYQSVSSKLAPSFPGKAVGVRIGQGATAEAAPAVENKVVYSTSDDLASLFSTFIAGLVCFSHLFLSPRRETLFKFHMS